MTSYNGLGANLSNLYRLSSAKTRSISPENFTGEKGRGGMATEDQEHPSVESPLGDFFCCGWNQFAQVNSLAVCVNPGRAFNCYWEMPFRKAARIEIENRDPENFGIIYYQIN